MKHLMLSIRLRIVAAFGACIALMIAIGMFGLVGLSRVNSNMKESYSGNLVPITSLSELRVAQYHLRLQTARIQIFHEADEKRMAIKEIREDQQRIEKAWNTYYPGGITSDAERDIAQRIVALLPRFNAATEELLTALSTGDDAVVFPAIRKLIPVGNEFNELLEKDAALNLAQAEQFVRDGDATFRLIWWIAIALIVVGAALAAGVSIYLLRAISRPLNQALLVANRIAAGELENLIDVGFLNEFGLLLDALKCMDARLGVTVRLIRANSESVAMASREIAHGNADLSARTEEQAASLEQTAASMTQLTQTVGQNSDNAQQASLLAKTAAEAAEDGSAVVQDMVRTIEKVRACSSQISDITGVIEGIAFQTNILALNASVEAARAGEQGRGFAVVAGEVRGLAQRSASAAKEIKDLIDSSVAMIESGAEKAADVSATVGQIRQAIRHVSDIVGEIASASEEQSRGIEQIGQAISELDQVTQQNAALVEQISATAQSLEEQASNLKDSVSVFKLAGT